MRQVPLSQGEYALVDDADFDEVSKHNWHAAKRGQRWYAETHIYRNGKRTTIGMHRFILNTLHGMHTDHIDGDGLNNCRLNLRECNIAENGRNRAPQEGCYSRFKGVTWSKRKKKWQAGIWPNGKTVWLGYFDDEEAAARAYNRVAQEFYGEFARLNIIHA